MTNKNKKTNSNKSQVFIFSIIQYLKPGLYIVVRAAEHACDDTSKRILKLSTYRLQIFLGKDQYLSSLQQYGDQAIAGQLEKHVLKPMLAILTAYMETRLKCNMIYCSHH